jgi:glycosyltransferase involved in cell wall biosynthesis
VFNGADFVKKALASILEQTYSNVDAIVVNDGSRDGGETRGAVLSMIDQAPTRIKYIEKENGGVSTALNRGILEARSDLIGWLSHDDLFLPRKIEMQLAFWRKLDTKDAIIISDYGHIDSEGRHLHDIKLDNRKLRLSSIYPVLGGCVNGCTILAPRELMQAHPFDEQYRHVQDYRLWWELCRKVGFYHLPEVTVHQRLHPGQDSRKPDALTEGNRLWIDIVSDTSGPERLQLHKSSYEFYKNMAAWLSQTPYVEAKAHADFLASKSAYESSVSIVTLSPGEQAYAEYVPQENFTTRLRNSQSEYVLFSWDVAPPPEASLRRWLTMAQVDGMLLSIAGDGRQEILEGPAAMLRIRSARHVLVNRHAVIADLEDEIGLGALLQRWSERLPLHVTA